VAPIGLDAEGGRVRRQRFQALSSISDWRDVALADRSASFWPA
jgi:hypothetical protein